MEKYNRLLATVATKYHIYKGTQEAEIDWKTRLVYSICGMMAYASLWDEVDGESISKEHLTRRVSRMLTNYKFMYPELSKTLPQTSKELESEIIEQFLCAGVMYHRPNRIAPSMKHEEPFEGILFQRGLALDRISCVSGVGFYAKQDIITNPAKIKAMFGLEYNTLQALWHKTISAASWKTGLSFAQNTEYLRLKPPFSSGYWINKPDTTGTVSILRTGIKGSWLYYLYRYSGIAMEVSPLSQWQVEDYNYRSLACACLSTYGTLPPIEYFKDGALVHIHMHYLLPPQELAFLKLYSWPEAYTSLPCNFKRKLSTEVFTAIKDVLSDEGYTFQGGTI